MANAILAGLNPLVLLLILTDLSPWLGCLILTSSEMRLTNTHTRFKISIIVIVCAWLVHPSSDSSKLHFFGGFGIGGLSSWRCSHIWRQIRKVFFFLFSKKPATVCHVIILFSPYHQDSKQHWVPLSPAVKFDSTSCTTNVRNSGLVLITKLAT